MNRKAKKMIYYALTMTLGLLFAFLFHAIVEFFYIDYSLSEGVAPDPGVAGHLCYLPLYIQIILPFAGIIGGYYLGRQWWYKVYEGK